MPPENDSTVLFSAVIRPHRSSGPRSARIVVLLVAGVMFLVGLAFIAAGAWPVAPFLGLEVLLLAIGLRLNQRAGNA